MKTFSFLIIAMVFTLQSCGQKQAAPVASSAKNKIVLGAFNDMTTLSSYNEEALGDFPRMVDFSQKMTSVKNQGHRGTCTFFAATALLEAAIKIDKGIDVNLSEEYSIYSTKYQGHYDDVEASHISVNLQAAKRGGILLEKDFSYRPNWFEKGNPCEGIQDNEDTPMHCFVHTPPKAALNKVIPGDSIKTGFIRKNTNEIIKYLATNERPLSISLPVNYSGWSDDGSVTYTEEMRQACLQLPASCGAHSVILTGYNLDEKVFYFKNSWGNDWGIAGFGKLSFDMVDRYVDGYLYYAKIDGDMAIPSDAQVDNLNVVSLAVKPALTESDIDLDINLAITEANGHYIEVHSFLGFNIVLSEGVLAPQFFPIYDSQYQYIYAMGNSSTLDFSGHQDGTISMPENILLAPNVHEAFSSTLYRPALTTKVVLYTDTSLAPIELLEVTTPLSK
ncbi:C1 family peptidase [Bacteriovorax sp. PP10]|uniref:C1 family peptidase n=1 Tax=Bacteriovorax antarcticus TaxID=3088717 RepID=A0ABU5VVF1_9BACT|nr:C1 family peptidase [Bacteriovorax sp. PP10]MEA9357021.1 C1 family peptidase [Bacteriovorax sp. PP10]